jgi:hypothetical protein
LRVDQSAIEHDTPLVEPDADADQDSNAEEMPVMKEGASNTRV